MLLAGGCGPKNYSITKMQHALELHQIITQASFRAMVIQVETSKSPDPSSPTNGPAVSNLYTISLKDISGKTHTIAGWDASDTEIDSINKLVVSNSYVFPDILFPKQ